MENVFDPFLERNGDPEPALLSPFRRAAYLKRNTR